MVKHYDYAKHQIDKGLPDGPFTGVPFLLKDLDLLEGTGTTFGASIFKNEIADHSGTLAQRFLNTGVTIFGKSASPEFGLMPTTKSRLHGPTRNPWNLAHSSGGSSGGAAAAVAARILPVAHASDGGGSIRIPASASGVFGLKPTRARNPLGPDRGEGWGGFSCGHVLSISVRDSAVMMDAISGPELDQHLSSRRRRSGRLPRRSKREPGRLRIAFTDKSPYGDAIDPEIAAAVRDVAAMLDKLGHHVEERAPKLPVDPAAVMIDIVGAEHGAHSAAGRAAFSRTMTEQDFELLTLAMAPQCAAKPPQPITSRPSSPAYRISRALSRSSGDLRRIPGADPVLAAGAARRAQYDVAGSLAYRADPAALHAGYIDVQHFGPARDVGAAGLEQERIAARHDVRRGLWRRGNLVSPCRAARTRASLAGQAAAGLCLNHGCVVPFRNVSPTKLGRIRSRGIPAAPGRTDSQRLTLRLLWDGEAK